MIAVTKEMLNKHLQGIMKGSYGSAVFENSMISAKWVDIRENRKCHSCGSVIPKGTTALTSSKRNEYGRPERIHRCYICGNKVIKRLNKDNSEIAETIFWEQVEEDAFYNEF